jgi:hypothetical protein
VGIDPDEHLCHELHPSRHCRFVDAGRALLLRAGQSPLEPRTGNGTRRESKPIESHTGHAGGQPRGELPAEYLDRVWPDTGLPTIVK